MAHSQNATNMPPPIAITLRMPEGLKAEADAYAEQLGISLNALLAVSLREYLNGRRFMAMPPSDQPADLAPAQSISVPVQSVAVHPAGLPALLSAPKPDKPVKQAKVADEDDFELDLRGLTPRKQYAAPINPKWNCPCGSKKPWLKCHGRAPKA